MRGSLILDVERELVSALEGKFVMQILFHTAKCRHPNTDPNKNRNQQNQFSIMSLTVFFFFPLYSTAIAERDFWTAEAQPNYRVRFKELSTYRVCFTQ